MNHNIKNENNEIGKKNSEPTEKQYREFLLLSLYFYLKNNCYDNTADILFEEANLSQIFKIPKGMNYCKNSPKDIKVLKDLFVNYFYKKSFFNYKGEGDIISEYWNDFYQKFSDNYKYNNLEVSPFKNKELIVKYLKMFYNSNLYNYKNNYDDEILCNIDQTKCININEYEYQKYSNLKSTNNCYNENNYK